MTDKRELVIKEIQSEEDVMATLHLAKAMHTELEPVGEFDAQVLTSHALACAQDLDRLNLNCWIVRRSGTPIGLGVGECRPPLYSREPIASLQFWYVLPQHRNTLCALYIFREFERWARLSGAIAIMVGAGRMNVEDADRINRMFEKRSDFQRYGTIYIKHTVNGAI